ncbi:MAG: response regulator [Lachnospiraceae bacterium]|nr:response regulator [Lachnospiraceae bacterium]MBR5733556.1 response regulator [Lachnospiraceae bacterium]
MIRIVVADDEPIEKAVVKKILEEAFGPAVEVYPACNGREAVDLWREKKCNIAVLDISMPGINGLDAAEIIRNEDEACVIIFLTAFDEFDYAQKAIRVRALDYLLKPVSENELVAVLEEAIRIAENGGNEKRNLLPPIPDKEELSSVKQAAIKKIIAGFIEENYVRDISLSDAANALHYSEPYFCKIFKDCFGKSFVLYLTELRVEKSKELLNDITVNVKDICTKVGFRDSNYYTKVFKRMEGMTPTEYRIIRGII